ncbi:nucleotidyl transferase AbiEii/AbiGii toxin family protein [Candidatus Kaiserbacteria bacterium]|nr:nucleotidyl transferase AbiEii/AbiGii toxin family protein [Candidatus Kaiserbacteria bacterium]
MGSDPKIISIAPSDLHTEALPPETSKAFFAFVNSDMVRSDWFLAGGTALALQVGHRSSEDLDFFTSRKDFDIAELEQTLSLHGTWETSRTSAGTLYGIFEGAKVSFIAYPFFRPSETRVQCGAIQLLVPDDIMGMKIIAISQRGKKRDFVDMYWYCAVHGGSLRDAILRAVTQFPERNHNIPHFFKSLVYFEDAEDDPMPKLHFKADWNEIKAYFKREVPRVTEEVLGLEL